MTEQSDPFRRGEEDTPDKAINFKLVLSLLLLTFLAISLMLGIVLGPVVYMLWTSEAFKPNPSDQEIIRLHIRHSEELERLLEMLAVDEEVSTVHPSYVRPEGSISDERWQEYKQIFEDVGLQAGVHRWGKEDSGVHFIVSTRGLVTGGSFKGLAYRPDGPSPLFSSLDSPAGLAPNQLGYRHVTGDWYILFSYDP